MTNEAKKEKLNELFDSFISLMAENALIDADPEIGLYELLLNQSKNFNLIVEMFDVADDIRFDEFSEGQQAVSLLNEFSANVLLRGWTNCRAYLRANAIPKS